MVLPFIGRLVSSEVHSGGLPDTLAALKLGRATHNIPIAEQIDCHRLLSMAAAFVPLLVIRVKGRPLLPRLVLEPWPPPREMSTG
jgi:hypothetical protein